MEQGPGQMPFYGGEASGSMQPAVGEVCQVRMLRTGDECIMYGVAGTLALTALQSLTKASLLLRSKGSRLWARLRQGRLGLGPGWLLGVQDLTHSDPLPPSPLRRATMSGAERRAQDGGARAFFFGCTGSCQSPSGHWAGPHCDGSGLSCPDTTRCSMSRFAPMQLHDFAGLFPGTACARHT